MAQILRNILFCSHKLTICANIRINENVIQLNTLFIMLFAARTCVSAFQINLFNYKKSVL
jgi:hypothetical protein